MIITIDGPAASGKSTVAFLLAERLGYYYLYSGLLFRALAYILEQESIVYQQDETILQGLITAYLFSDDFVYLYDANHKPCIIYKQRDITPELKTPEIDRLASIVSRYEQVRLAVQKYQRKIADDYNCIADGRDCGTVVFPQAACKFFLTASVIVRAKRWQGDQASQGKSYSLEQSIKEITSRDDRDLSREISPLIQAQDAVRIDNSELSIAQTVALMLDYIAIKKGQHYY